MLNHGGAALVMCLILRYRVEVLKITKMKSLDCFYLTNTLLPFATHCVYVQSTSLVARSDKRTDLSIGERNERNARFHSNCSCIMNTIARTIIVCLYSCEKENRSNVSCIHCKYNQIAMRFSRRDCFHLNMYLFQLLHKIFYFLLVFR